MNEKVISKTTKEGVMPHAFNMVRKMGLITDTMVNTVILRLRCPMYSKEVELLIDKDNKSIECIYHVIKNFEENPKKTKSEAVSYANSVLKEYFWEYEIKVRIRST